MITPEQLVSREVRYCISSLVSTLAVGANGVITYNGLSPRNPRLSPISPIMAICDQAAELCYPIPDYESAAIDAGWVHEAPDALWVIFDGRDENFTADTAADACELHDIEPHDREVFEHWIVSDWLADKLAEHGEKVDKDFAGLTVWARTTTGQGIASDSVIIAITNEVNAA